MPATNYKLVLKARPVPPERHGRLRRPQFKPDVFIGSTSTHQEASTGFNQFVQITKNINNTYASMGICTSAFVSVYVCVRERVCVCPSKQ